MTYRVYDIPSIPCLYKGINFKSKTEVRWAVFFDFLGWEWIYEDDYYRLPCGMYLPDFYFPDIKAHAEVKPDDFTPVEREKCIQLSELFKDTQVIQLIGNPSVSSMPIIENGAYLTDAIAVKKSSKFYPLFYIDRANDIDFPDTYMAITSSKNYAF